VNEDFSLTFSLQFNFSQLFDARLIG